MDAIEKLIERLKVKFPDKYISIENSYHSHVLLNRRADTDMFYRLYIQGTFNTPSAGLTFKMLNVTVNELVTDYKKRQTEYYFCEIDDMEYCYMIDPDDGSIELDGGIPSSEMDIIRVKADCLRHYEKNVANADDPAACDRGLEMERGKI